jgi:hypothetical protein
MRIKISLLVSAAPCRNILTMICRMALGVKEKITSVFRSDRLIVYSYQFRRLPVNVAMAFPYFYRKS